MDKKAQAVLQVWFVSQVKWVLHSYDFRGRTYSTWRLFKTNVKTLFWWIFCISIRIVSKWQQIIKIYTLIICNKQTKKIYLYANFVSVSSFTVSSCKGGERLLWCGWKTVMILSDENNEMRSGREKQRRGGIHFIWQRLWMNKFNQKVQVQPL